MQSLNTKSKLNCAVCFVGPPASGKDTTANQIRDKYNLVVITPGDIYKRLREENSELGLLVKESLKDGGYCPNWLTNKIVYETASEVNQVSEIFDPGRPAFMLNGYPRSVEQLEFLDENFDVKAFVHIDAPYEECLEAAVNRRSCITCKNVFSKKNPPRATGVQIIDMRKLDLSLLVEEVNTRYDSLSQDQKALAKHLCENSKSEFAIGMPRCNCMKDGGYGFPEDGELCASKDGEIAWETRWDDTAELYEKRYKTYMDLTQPILDAISGRPNYKKFNILTDKNGIGAVEEWIKPFLGENC